jgi:hypothetical protein
MAPPLRIPEDVRKFVKDVFSLCNVEATKNLSNNPNAPEQYLDLSVINVLASHSSPVRLASGWLVRIETHYLGSLRHYRNWEIADIGLLLSVRQPNQPRIAKVGLLQSKRLYPKNFQVNELLPIDFEMGFGRLLHPEDDQSFHAGMGPTSFDFTDDCRYGALSIKGDQYKAIKDYESERRLKVYYSFYNPWIIPFQTTVPVASFKAPSGKCEAGVRVVPSQALRGSLNGKRKGYNPSFRDIKAIHVDGGWRLEDFVIDHFFRCTEGDIFESMRDDRIFYLFNRRSGAIAAAVAINIENPGRENEPQKRQ